MECNKEEAIRAKGVAETKMLNKDFTSARKIILKAQKLFPELENASHMLTVCEVHCAAEVKVNGEKDWYGILQAAPNADELTIKKQYRKLALLLHPDKNNFGGAEAAFKLIGEAQRTLTDRSKRGLHDMQRATFRPVSVHQPPQPNGFNQQKHTFWTMCPGCNMKYQYYAEIKDRTLSCQNCKKFFVARDLNTQAMPSAAPWNRSGIPQQGKQGPNFCYSGPKSKFTDRFNVSKVFESGNGSKNDAKLESDGENNNELKFEEVNLPGVKKKTQVTKNSNGSTSQKRARKRETVKSESSSKTKNVGTVRGRKSARQKQNICYDEVIIDSDDDFVSQKTKKSKTENTNHVNLEENNKDNSEENNSLSYLDPEFCDFGEDRKESKFAANQIWAIYDNVDAMPRFYALIRGVYGPKFKLRFNWLEFDPTNKAEALWSRNELPTGVGNFRLGKTEHTQELLMFSHVMTWNRSILKNNTYKIYPRKGEVWAILKNWDIGWSSNNANSERKYEYEVVEVLSDFSSGPHITVVRLVKIQGFVSLFMQATDKGSTFNIKLTDMLQFSHKVPSYRMIGHEREGVPQGCLELDCASLPLNFAETLPSVNLDSHKSNAKNSNNICEGLLHNSSCNKEQNDVKDNITQQPMTDPAHSYAYPDSEFHNFEEDRLTDKFKVGQIWALYSEVNKNPNYYGRITKIEKEEFKVHLTWLEGCNENDDEKHWFNQGLPVGCGTFIINPEATILDSAEAFSHIVHTHQPDKNSTYSIHPCVGEVWAIYKNWSLKWVLSDLEKSDFDLVEVLDSNSSRFKVSILTKASGYSTVFTSVNNSVKTMEIPSTEQLKFSHRIPSFKLTDEKDGKLRGYLELDPAAIPEILTRRS